MRRLRLAPLAVLWKFDLALNKFLVFAGPIVNTTALGTAEFYESFLLCHIGQTIPFLRFAVKW
jgi:hypothetical protein